MADYFTSFSFVVETNDDQRTWLKNVHADILFEIQDYDINKEKVTKERNGELYKLIIDNDYCPENINIGDVQNSTNTIIYSNNGSVDYTTTLIQEFQRVYNIQTPICFSWSNSCSKMVPNEFGGGVVGILPDRVITRDTSSIMNEVKELLSKQTQNNVK